MPDPLILDVRGIEVEIRLWRGTDNKFLLTLQTGTGAPIPLGNRDVTFTLVDRPGGTVKFSQMQSPGGHLDESAGQTIITVPASVTSGLTAPREYTWKYTVVVHERTIGERNIHFFGDARISAPSTPVVVQVLTLVLVESVTVTEVRTPVTV